MAKPILTTERLILRQWEAQDVELCVEMNSDAETMRFFPAPLTREQTEEQVARWANQIEDHGWGLFAVDRKDTGEFIGTVGLVMTRDNLPFKSSMEIGWRLRKEHWNHGFATEAATRVLAFAKDVLKEPRIISITAVINVPSQNVMEKIGLVNTGRDFMHPSIDPNHPVAPHVLYETPLEWNPSD